MEINPLVYKYEKKKNNIFKRYIYQCILIC